MTINSNKIFRSKDLYLSAFLSFKGAKLISAERENGKVFFCFENNSKITGLIREFTSGDMSGFIREIYNLKVLLNTT